MIESGSHVIKTSLHCTIDTPGKIPPTISKLKDEQIPSKTITEEQPTNSTDPGNEAIKDKFIPELLSSIISEAQRIQDATPAIYEEESMKDPSKPPTFEIEPIKNAPISLAIPEEESIKDRFFFGNIATPIPSTIPENPIKDATMNAEKPIADENGIKGDLMGMFYPTQGKLLLIISFISQWRLCWSKLEVNLFCCRYFGTKIINSF